MSDLDAFTAALRKAHSYGLGEFLEIIGELSQVSGRKGALERRDKELITLGMALAKRCGRCIEIHSRDALKHGATHDEVAQVEKIVLFINASPHHEAAMWKAWKDSWRDFVAIHGPIAHATRELIAMGISLVRQNPEHIALHGESALEHGATRQQLIEVMPLALLMDGAPAISQIPRLLAIVDAAS